MQLNPAPQSQTLYVSYESLQPLPEPIDQNTILQTIRFKFESKQWVDNVEAINVLRRLNKVYPQSMNQVCEMFWNHILKSVDNVKTAICKTILMFLTELFINVNVNLNDVIIQTIVPKLALKSHTNSKLLRTEAEQAYQSAVTKCLKESLIISLAHSCQDKNPKISELSFKALFHVLSLVGQNILNLQAETFKHIFVAVKFGLFGKRTELKKQATSVCKGVYQVLGETNFEQLITMLIQGQILDQRDIKHIQEIFTQKQSNQHVSLSTVLKNRRKQSNAFKNQGIHNF